jgi:hypothetical protein
MTTNQIAYFSAKEQQRHNWATEREQGRHNIETEKISSETNTINRTHLERMDSETMRHNLATEEQARQQLGLGYAQLDLGNRQLAETTRHNKASESLTLQSLQETTRHNYVSETLSRQSNDITNLHNIETERQTDFYNGVLAGKVRAETTKIKEETTGQYINNLLTQEKVPYAAINEGLHSQQEAWKTGQLENETKTYGLRFGIQSLNQLIGGLSGLGNYQINRQKLNLQEIQMSQNGLWQ